MDWERWEAPVWEYPTNIEDPDFSKMLVIIYDSISFLIENDAYVNTL
jgi:hypothetical protein